MIEVNCFAAINSTKEGDFHFGGVFATTIIQTIK